MIKTSEGYNIFKVDSQKQRPQAAALPRWTVGFVRSGRWTAEFVFYAASLEFTQRGVESSVLGGGEAGLLGKRAVKGAQRVKAHLLADVGNAHA